MNQPPLPYEEEEPVALVQWLELSGYIFTSIPNSTWTPSRKQKRKNYAMGLRSGLPDLLIILPGKGLLFIEMKRQKGGEISECQKIWIEELNKIEGVEAIVCKGFEEAKKIILSF
jgi:hypothetical protein